MSCKSEETEDTKDLELRMNFCSWKFTGLNDKEAHKQSGKRMVGDMFEVRVE